MGVKGKLTNTRKTEYILRESSLTTEKSLFNSLEFLTMLCQKKDEGQSRLIKVLSGNVFVKYSQDIKEPTLRLEVSDIVPDGFSSHLYYLLIADKNQPLKVAYISVPEGYKGILGKYAE